MGNRAAKKQEFIKYVLSFYGINGLYADFFGKGVSEQEVKIALEIRLKNKTIQFDWDSFDREIIRDIMLYQKGKRNNLEYPMNTYFESQETSKQ